MWTDILPSIQLFVAKDWRTDVISETLHIIQYINELLKYSLFIFKNKKEILCKLGHMIKGQPFIEISHMFQMNPNIQNVTDIF